MTTYLPSNDAQLWLVTPGFDDLLLLGTTIDDDGHEWTMKAQAENASWDNPVPVDVSVQRWMTDGAVASTQGHDNRSPTFQVIVSAGNAVDLAYGEAALAQRATQSCLLVWYPPSGPDVAPASVFEVWTWHLQHQFDPDREQRLSRIYTVAMTAKPWVRSLNPTTAEAVQTTGTPTSTQVDDCTSVTGWTGTPNTPTVTGGTAIHEQVSSPDGLDTQTLTLTRTGTVTGMDTTPYLAIDTRTRAPTTTSLTGSQILSQTIRVDGVACTLVGQVGTVYYWQVPAGVTSFSTLTISVQIKKTASIRIGTDTISLDVYDVTRANFLSGVGSQKMLTRHLDVGGSVKTTGSIQISSPDSSAFGATMVYTYPDTGTGYAPPMRQYRTSGGTITADSSCVSGSHELFAGAGGGETPTIVYSVPAGVLREATYVVVARFVSDGGSSTDFSPQFSTLDASGNVVDSISRPDASVGSSGVAWLIMGAISIPGTSRAPESAQPVLLQFEQTPGFGASGITVNLDEVFVVDVTHGALSLLFLSTSSGYTQVWLDSPDADPATNRPAVYVGTSADRSDAERPPYDRIASLGDHEFDPGGTTVFTVTGSLDNASVAATYYHRWHTHAGD